LTRRPVTERRNLSGANAQIVASSNISSMLLQTILLNTEYPGEPQRIFRGLHDDLLEYGRVDVRQSSDIRAPFAKLIFAQSHSDQ
jgi:hypothetical protein